MSDRNGSTRESHTAQWAGGIPWTALIEDVGDPVLVLDGEGRITHINVNGAALLGSTVAAATGRNLSEFYAAEFAQERLGFVRSVARTGQALVIDGMVNGVWCRATIRRLTPESDSLPMVLVVLALGDRSPGNTGAALGGATVVRATIDDLGPLAVLTHREIEILRLIGNGLSTAEIAHELHRSVKTIEWHRVSLGTKLKATNRVGLAKIAIHAGLSALGANTPRPTPEAV